MISGQGRSGGGSVLTWFGLFLVLGEFCYFLTLEDLLVLLKEKLFVSFSSSCFAFFPFNPFRTFFSFKLNSQATISPKISSNICNLPAFRTHHCKDRNEWEVADPADLEPS